MAPFRNNVVPGGDMSPAVSFDVWLSALAIAAIAVAALDLLIGFPGAILFERTAHVIAFPDATARIAADEPGVAVGLDERPFARAAFASAAPTGSARTGATVARATVG